MKKWLTAYFGLSKKEYNGVVLLILLILLISVLPHIYECFRPVDHDDAFIRSALRELAKQKKLDRHPRSYRSGFRKDSVTKIARLFHFDPNKIGIDEWLQLGLSERQAGAVLNYLSKGGRFRQAEDLRKMYTINAEVYNRIYPFVRIRSDPGQSAIETSRYKPNPLRVDLEGKRGLKIIEVNGADSIQLEEIKGVGPAFARRILKYRERLGGFYKKEQLLEVFGLDSLKYQEIKDQIVLDENKLRKINVNTAVQEDFKYHPYIRYKQVNALIEYRKQHGNYSNIAELNKVVILDPELIARMAPYFSF